MTDKNKTNTYGTLELTKEEYVTRWMGVADNCNRLVSWRDIDYTQKRVNIIKSLIKTLAEHNFDLDADDVSIHYDLNGNIDSHRIGKETIL